VCLRTAYCISSTDSRRFAWLDLLRSVHQHYNHHESWRHMSWKAHVSTRLDVYLSSKSSTWSGRRARRTFFSSEHHKKRWSASSNKPSVKGMILSHHSVHSFKWMITFTYLLATQMPFWGHFFYDLSSY
jgi:hypothetical protein